MESAGHLRAALAKIGDMYEAARLRVEAAANPTMTDVHELALITLEFIEKILTLRKYERDLADRTPDFVT